MLIPTQIFAIPCFWISSLQSCTSFSVSACRRWRRGWWGWWGSPGRLQYSRRWGQSTNQLEWLRVKYIYWLTAHTDTALPSSTSSTAGLGPVPSSMVWEKVWLSDGDHGEMSTIWRDCSHWWHCWHQLAGLSPPWLRPPVATSPGQPIIFIMRENCSDNSSDSPRYHKHHAGMDGHINITNTNTT